MRHDTAHILAMAVQELFKGTQVTIGPVIDNGFYYDFSRKEPFTKDDLNKIDEIVQDEKETIQYRSIIFGIFINTISEFFKRREVDFFRRKIK